MDGTVGLLRAKALLESVIAGSDGLPIAVFEPVDLRLLPCDLRSSATNLIGRVSAPGPVSSTSLHVQCMSQYVIPGKPFVFRITLDETYSVGGPEDVEAGLVAVLRHAEVYAELLDPATPLLASLQPDIASRGVLVSIRRLTQLLASGTGF
jgi:hypothetical protein